MQEKKVAVVLYHYTEKNFQSGGEKVNFFIVKVLNELGFSLDLFCKKLDDSNSLFFKNIYCNENIQFDQQEYLFSIGENLSFPRTFLYIHENTRHFQNKYTRNNFTRFIQKIFSPKRAKLIKKRLDNEYISVKNSKFLLLPSSIVKNDLLEFFDIEENKVFLLPPPIEEKNFQFENNINNAIFTFGLSARGFANKGGWNLILAAFLLKLIGEKFRILIIYPFTKTLKFVEFFVAILGLASNIKFLDYCSDMNQFYSKIDCLILASKREAFGLVAPEAMIRKIPVIVNSRCGICDFIQDEKNGFVYDYDKPLINLFKKMKYVLNNKNNLTFVKNNSVKIGEQLNYANFKNQFKNILVKVGFLSS